MRTRTLAVLFCFVFPSLAVSLAAQGVWHSISSSTAPPRRERTSIAYDASRGLTLLFGGSEDGTGWTPLGDTWTWDGQNWVELHPSLTPSPRRTVMVYDSGRDRVVLFGGFGGTAGHFQDTWEWDGTRWNLMASAGPAPRREHGMAYDAARGVVVLFGGRDHSLRFDDTWEWDGSQWTERTPIAQPSARSGHGMVFDPVRGVTVLQGGSPDAAPALNDTWLWDGSDWVQALTLVRPPRAVGIQMTFDSNAGVCVAEIKDPGALHGFDTWEWNGQAWQQNASSSNGEDVEGMAYDSARNRVVAVFEDATTSLTLEYVRDPVATASRFGSGCLGTNGIPSLDVAPGQLARIGGSVSFELRSIPASAVSFGLLSRSRVLYAGLPLPVPLDAIGMPSCSLLVGLDMVGGIPTLGTVGAWIVPIPNDSGLAGQEFFVQSLVQDPGANPLGLTVSNGVELVIGAR